MGVIFQVLATCIISFICMTMGMMYTWPSSTMVIFSSPNTTLDRVMTETEVSLMGSIASISALLVTPFSGYFLDGLGRKRSCILFYLVQVVCWVIIVAFNKVEAVLFAMFLSGLTGSMMLVIPIYVSELCQESIRGSMTSSAMIFYGIGMLFSYLLGGLLEYHIRNYVCLTLTIFGLTIFSFMKDSPLFLMKKGQEKDAARAVSFYRGAKVNSKEVTEEIETIRRILSYDENELSPETPQEEKELNEKEVPKKKISQWKYLMTSGPTKRALFVCIVLYTAAVFQGLVVLQVYAGPLFEQAVPNMSSTLASVIFAIITVIAGFFGAYFVDKFGRRSLMMYASIATGLFCMIFGSQIHLHWGPSWVTAIFMYLYTITFTFGAGTVPFVVIAEVFMPEIKGLTSMIAMEWAFICSFVILFIFNPLVSIIGLGPVFYIFSACSFFSAVFCYFCLPETMGLPVDVIQQKFGKNFGRK